MKNFELAGLTRLLVMALLGIGLILLNVPGAIAAPSFPQPLIAQAAEAQPAPSHQASSTSRSTEGSEKLSQPEQPTTGQRPPQKDQQHPSETTAPREQNRGDRPPTPTPYDPYDMGEIQQFDRSWYGQ